MKKLCIEARMRASASSKEKLQQKQNNKTAIANKQASSVPIEKITAAFQFKQNLLCTHAVIV